MVKFFGTTPKFWLGLQDDYDLEEELNNKAQELKEIRTITNNEA
ncbi:HigA protein (antitoxin to HigB) [Fulvivirga imtechensis AK7]|uniref:HigA protein (Antitoxin to HigB) n=1 Tax=Fulvivirga imtechensis AK7 TaxID=1237149 RepID=L8JN25_9BACT|nr:HigA protein (antitoxin to HigB) [Fulvivirga imtechensis AK7]